MAEPNWATIDVPASPLSAMIPANPNRNSIIIQNNDLAVDIRLGFDAAVSALFGYIIDAAGGWWSADDVTEAIYLTGVGAASSANYIEDIDE